MIPELEHATDGALRVARRKMLMANELSRQAYERLELAEYGDMSRSNGVWDNVAATEATTDEAVKRLESELDKRDAPYKPKQGVREQVR